MAYTIYGRISRKQKGILRQGGQPYLEKAGNVATSFKGMWGGHCNEDAAALAYLKKLTPAQIAEVNSVLEATDYLVAKARKDPALAREIIEASTDEGYRDLMKRKGFDYTEDSIGALRAIDPYRMADSFLSRRKSLSLGSGVHNIDREWKYGIDG